MKSNHLDINNQINLLGLNTNKLLKNSSENDSKLKVLKVDAGRLIQKF